MIPHGITLCPLCHGPLRQAFDASPQPSYRLDCHNCGDHRFDPEAVDRLADDLLDDASRARIAHGVFQIGPDDVIDLARLRRLREFVQLPPALDRIDRLIQWLASQPEPGEPVHLSARVLRARLGCASVRGADWVVDQAMTMGLLQPLPPVGHVLTAAGWQRWQLLQREAAGSRHAFMAMAFGQPELDSFYLDWLQPGVQQTGFQLRTTAHADKTPGLIDNRMRVELRTSRFAVVDLSHGNRGAYWEAGFAEALGRPVFYLCRKDVRDDPLHPDRPHFDANHQPIIAWDPRDPAWAVQELQAMIRATLPAETVMASAAAVAQS